MNLSAGSAVAHENNHGTTEEIALNFLLGSSMEMSWHGRASTGCCLPATLDTEYSSLVVAGAGGTTIDFKSNRSRTCSQGMCCTRDKDLPALTFHASVSLVRKHPRYCFAGVGVDSCAIGV